MAPAKKQNLRESTALSQARAGVGSKTKGSSLFVSLIVFDQFVAPSHLRQTLGELELEAGERDMNDLDRDSQMKNVAARICVVLDLFHDEFGIYRTTHRTTGGTYIQPLNMNYKGRDEPQNYSLSGFVPFGCTFNDVAEDTLQELAVLARGINMTVDGKKLNVLFNFHFQFGTL